MKSFCKYMDCSYEFDLFVMSGVGLMWCLIVLIPDLCPLSYLGKYHFNSDIRNFISHITPLCSLLYTPFKGQIHVFVGQVKIVSHSTCRTRAILKFLSPGQASR